MSKTPKIYKLHLKGKINSQKLTKLPQSEHQLPISNPKNLIGSQKITGIK